MTWETDAEYRERIADELQALPRVRVERGRDFVSNRWGVWVSWSKVPLSEMREGFDAYQRRFGVSVDPSVFREMRRLLQVHSR